MSQYRPNLSAWQPNRSWDQPISRNPPDNPSIYDRSAKEISDYLNNGQYIPQATRKLLEEKLVQNPKSVWFTSKDEVRLIPPSDAKKIDQKIKAVDFPELSKTAEIANKQQPKLNYGNIINNKNSSEEAKNNNSTLNPLFVDDNLVLSYYDITKMYQSCAIYRIQLSYITVHQKIRIIDMLDKATELKQKFDYDKLVAHGLGLKRCINIYIQLTNFREMFDSEHLLHLLTLRSDQLRISSTVRSPTNAEFIVLEQLQPKMDIYNNNNFASLFVGPYSKYQAKITEYVYCIQYVAQNFSMLDKKSIDLLMQKVSEIYSQLGLMIDHLVKENDTRIDCDYYVCLAESAEQSPIYPIGLATFVYMSCLEGISLFVPDVVNNDVFNENDDELKNYFSRIKNDDAYFIQITAKDQPKLHINFYLEPDPPKAKMCVKITDLPENSKILTCFVKNNNLIDDNEINMPIIIPWAYNKNSWLNCRTGNDSLTEDEYNKLDLVWKEHYSYQDTGKNRFTVDYLFSQLLENDTNELINPEMLASFRNLAYSTSSI